MSLMVQRMRGRWRSALTALGVDGKFLVNRSGPCPICAGDTRFRFDDKGGEGTSICNQCGAMSGFQLLMARFGWDFRETCNRLEEIMPDLKEEPVKRERTEAEKRAAMRKVWEASKPLDGADPASRYLMRRVGAFEPNRALRFHPALEYYPGPGMRSTTHPAMVARVEDSEGKPVNIHRTYLTRDGHKAQVREPKMTMQGDLPDGCAIRLTPIAETLGVAEGIETALAVTSLHDVPCWSTISSGRLEKWTPPEGVKTVLVFGDNDVSATGQAAAWALVKRLRAAGIKAPPPQMPPEIGTDWCDALAFGSRPQEAA